MRIDGPGATRSSTVRRPRSTDGSSGSFAGALGNETADATTAAPLARGSGVASIDAVLALQGVGEDDDAPKKQRTMQRAEALLDGLEELKIRMALGGIPASTLSALVRKLETDRDTVSDPRLTAILDEVDLRARVELAKLGIDPA